VTSRLGGSFSASHTRVRERNHDVAAPGAGDLPWDLRLGVEWDPARRWSLRAAWRVSAGVPTTPLRVGTGAAGEPVPVLGRLRSERLGDLHSLDLELVREWTLARGSLQLVLDVENAYNASNARGYEHDFVVGEGATRIDRRELTWPGRLPGFRVRWVF
jgi:hypothetical protein